MGLATKLERFWQETFPAVVPIPHLLRDQLPSRWVRFHHLPQSKRYPVTEAEYRAVLERHDKIMATLFDQAELVVVAGTTRGDGDGRFDDDKIARVAGPLEPWRSGYYDVYFDDVWHLYAGTCDYDRGRHAILRWLANWDSAHVILLQPPVPVLYRPYDGGMDVIAADQESRDRLVAAFPSWVGEVTGDSAPMLH